MENPSLQLRRATYPGGFFAPWDSFLKCQPGDSIRRLASAPSQPYPSPTRALPEPHPEIYREFTGDLPDIHRHFFTVNTKLNAKWILHAVDSQENPGKSRKMLFAFSIAFPGKFPGGARVGLG